MELESLRYAQVVGNTFVDQYYHFLTHSPDLVHRFYHQSSKLGRPDEHGDVTSVTTIDAINEKILSTDFFDPEIKKVDCQDSLNGGVVVIVRGSLTSEGNVKRDFVQSFFLAPQERGYYVLNDLLVYVGQVHQHPVNCTDTIGSPLVHENDAQHVISPSDEKDVKVVEDYNTLSNGVSSTLPEEELGNVINKDLEYPPLVVKSKDTSARQEVEKQSYASVVKTINDNGSISSPAWYPAKTASGETQHSIRDPATHHNLTYTTAAGSKKIQRTENDDRSIYLRNLPLETIPAQLEEELKWFGPIKPGGIQVKCNKLQTSCFGFVEFKLAGAAQSAVEASPIIMAGRKVYIEEKRMVSSGVNNRGRFTVNNGGRHQNDGARDHGNWRNSTGHQNEGTRDNWTNFSKEKYRTNNKHDFCGIVGY